MQLQSVGLDRLGNSIEQRFRVLLNLNWCLFSGVVRIWQGGMTVWGRSSQRGPGAEPLVGGQWAKPPWSWNTFCFWMFNGNRKFAHFSEIWKRKRPSNIVEFCNFCWKIPKKRIFHIKSPVKKFHGRAKEGGHRTVLPKYASVLVLVDRPFCRNMIQSAWHRPFFVSKARS